MRGIKLIKKHWKRLRKSRNKFALLALALVIVTAAIVIERNAMNANYTELLNTIADGESKGNYNAHYGNSQNATIDFTAMKVSDVLAWQRAFVADGHASSAVGKYQFIEPTLRGLVHEMGIDSEARFDPALQDRLAIRLLERRGAKDYLRGTLSREQFAHNLSKEWAALPRVIGGDPSSSYYAGDGLNHVQISIDRVFAAIDNLRNVS